eukprot:m.49318 g.49318  ORF g.49318 m.49318 type:complete len:132 (+) comp17906_c0_seq2:173-568(+)
MNSNLVLMIQWFFSSILVPLRDVYIWLRWIFWCSFGSYGITAVILAELGEDDSFVQKFMDPPITTPAHAFSGLVGVTLVYLCLFYITLSRVPHLCMDNFLRKSDSIGEEEHQTLEKDEEAPPTWTNADVLF